MTYISHEPKNTLFACEPFNRQFRSMFEMENRLFSIICISLNLIVLINCQVHPECYVCDSNYDENCKILNDNSFLETCVVPAFKTDICYTENDGINIIRGCFNDKDIVFQNECSNFANTLCSPCDYDNCNKGEVIPLECVECDSSADQNCVTLTRPISNKVCKLGSKCFTGIYNKKTYRGCYHEDDTSVLNEKCPDSMCEICSNKDNCNDLVYPYDRLSCHHCSGDQACNNLQDDSTRYPCKNYVTNDQCYLFAKGLYAQRGCLSDSDQFSQNCEDNIGLCITCSKPDCNDQNSIVEYSCHFCDELEPLCYAYPADTLTKTCKIFSWYAYNLECYTYTKDNKIVRDCLYDVGGNLDPKCTNDPNNCELCNAAVEPLCNKNRVSAPKDSCIKCRSSNPDCNKANEMLALTEECYSHLDNKGCYILTDGTVFERGCITNLSDDLIIIECKGNGDTCTSCLEQNCNIQFVDSCIECDSPSSYCNNENEKLGVTKICNIHTDRRGCYTQSDGVNIKRGCMSDLLDVGMITECETNGVMCKSCFGENCNIKSVIKCYACDSDEDPTCVDQGTNSVTCKNLDDTCLVYVKEHGKTVRGCSKDLDPQGDGVICNAENCLMCTKDNCNNARFPSDRLKCLKCSSATDSDCLSGSNRTVSVTCQNYASVDECFSIVRDDSTNIIRGCLSDNGNTATECKSNNVCEKCNTDNCNTIALSKPPTLSCIQCDGASSDPQCVWGFNEVDAAPCTKNIFFNDLELCYTYQNGNLVKRGCVNDEELCGDENEACETCSVRGCNNEHKTESRCFICDSRKVEEEYCNGAFEDTDTIACTNGMQLFENRGCYTYNAGDYVLRGCVSSLNEKIFNECKDIGFEDCNICYTDGCNKREPNFANRLYYLSFITLISVSLFMKLLN